MRAWPMTRNPSRLYLQRQFDMLMIRQTRSCVCLKGCRYEVSDMIAESALCYSF